MSFLYLLPLFFHFVSTNRFQVLHLIPNDQNALRTLHKLSLQDHKYKIDFWKEAAHIGDGADLMISEKERNGLERIFERNNISYSISVPDVQKLIMRNEGPRTKLRNILNFTRYNDDPILDSEPDLDHSRVGRLKKAKYPFGDYSSYADMIKYMRTIEFYYPNITKIIRLGTTHEGKPIEGLRIGRPSTNGTIKRAVWMDGNIHAREWASSHTALFIINQLVSGYGKDDLTTHYLNSLDFFVVPCLNPDGYEYTRSSPVPNIRLWRKNRSPERCQKSLWGGEKCCQGVDLNRNFKFHWSESGSSFEPCSNIYHGEYVFSEPESRAVNDYLSSPDMFGRVDAFITLHSYAQLWIYPYSHAEQSYPEDIAQLRKTARKAINRLEKQFGTQYRMGTGADTLSPASGGSDDWAKSEMGIKYVYLIELRPEMELSNGFILHKKELIPTAIETFEGIREVIDAVLEQNGLVRDLMQRISSNMRIKQLYRMRLLNLTSASTVEPTTRRITASTRASDFTAMFRDSRTTTTTEQPTEATSKRWKSKFFEKLTTKKSDLIEETATEEPTTEAPPTTVTHKVDPRYLNNKPRSFRDPKCRDMRYSCGFWLKANKDVCVEQHSFMKAQCAFTCKFCISTLVDA